jgi:CBS domain containing-hemolysin-like protein
MSDLLLVALGLLFVLANGFFVAAEFAIVKVRATQLEEIEERSGRRVEAARTIVRHLDTYLSSTQLGVTLSSLALGWIGEPAFAHLVEAPLAAVGVLSPRIVQGVAFAVAFSIISVLHIVLGELAPKSLAIRFALPVALWIAIPLHLFTRVAWPAIWLLNSTANRFLALIRIPPASEGGELHSEEEIRILLDESTARGTMSPHRRELLDGFFDFTKRTARQIMIPRTDVAFLRLDDPIEKSLDFIRRTRHTRYPLCERDLDHTVGMVHVKDLLFRPPGEEIADLRSVQREILFVPESLPVEQLMVRFRTQRIHMAVVVDEYGGGAGVVTFENVLEELVGQIDDEFDQDRPEFEQLAGGESRVRGDFLLSDLAQRLDVEIGESESDTVGGLVIERLARAPRPGDRIELAGYELVVEEARSYRVHWVRARPLPLSANK